jgi:hypothetical protein
MKGIDEHVGWILSTDGEPHPFDGGGHAEPPGIHRPCGGVEVRGDAVFAQVDAKPWTKPDFTFD